MNGIASVELRLMVSGDDAELERVMSRRDPRERAAFGLEHSHELAVDVGVRVRPAAAGRETELERYLVAVQGLAIAGRQNFDRRALRRREYAEPGRCGELMRAVGAGRQNREKARGDEHDNREHRFGADALEGVARERRRV